MSLPRSFFLIAAAVAEAAVVQSHSPDYFANGIVINEMNRALAQSAQWRVHSAGNAAVAGGCSPTVSTRSMLSEIGSWKKPENSDRLVGSRPREEADKPILGRTGHW